MNVPEYRAICKQQNAFRISELRETLNVLKRSGAAEEASIVTTALVNNVVEVPEPYLGCEDEHFCLVQCSFEQADVIVEALFDAEASSIPATGEPTTETSKLVNLVNKWSIFRETL